VVLPVQRARDDDEDGNGHTPWIINQTGHAPV
jgi:hypothetical protein